MPLTIHWESDNPSEHTAESEIMLENDTAHPLESATEIHNDFRGVDFWRAIFCTLGDAPVALPGSSDATRVSFTPLGDGRPQAPHDILYHIILGYIILHYM